MRYAALRVYCIPSVTSVGLVTFTPLKDALAKGTYFTLESCVNPAGICCSVAVIEKHKS